MCSASSSVTSPYTCPHPGHSQGKIFAHLAQGYVPTLFGRKEQYKVTVCILRFVPPQGTPEESHSVLLAYQGFPGGSAGKEFACNAGDLGSIPALGRSPGEGKGYPFQYSGLENSTDCIVHGVAKSWTWLSDFHFSTPISRGEWGLACYEGDIRDICVPGILIELRRLHFIPSSEGLHVDGQC